MGGSSPYTHAHRLGYQPQLDGVRAVAVLAVMIYHAGVQVRGRDLAGGFLGVDMFFVLSGFLVTSLLCTEYANLRTVVLRNFYFRRALRLLPALVITIGLGAFVVRIVDGTFERPYWQSAAGTLTYVANWLQISESLRPLEHTWALAIAAQYYLVWPVLLLLGLRADWDKRRLGWIILALAVAMAVARYTTFDGGHQEMAALSTLTRPDGLLIGSALGLFLVDPPRALVDFLRRRDVALMSLAVIGAAMLTFRVGQPEIYRGGLLFVNAATALLVGHVVTARTSFIRRAFSAQPLPAIGRISYGLYLFHFPITYIVFGFPAHRSGYVATAAVFALSFAMAGASYLLIEEPIMGMKKRFGSMSALWHGSASRSLVAS